MKRAKAKIRDASRELKYPCGYIHPTGYVMAVVCRQNAQGFWNSSYEYVHRLNFESWTKIQLNSEDFIHHIDGDRQNNHWTNLSRLSRADHNAHALHNARKVRKAKKFKRERVFT